MLYRNDVISQRCALHAFSMRNKKADQLVGFLQAIKNYLEAGAAVAEAAGAASEAGAASDAAAGAGAAAGVSAAAEAGAGATADAAGASSFLPQAAKAIANRDTSKSDFFMFVLSISRSKK